MMQCCLSSRFEVEISTAPDELRDNLFVVEMHAIINIVWPCLENDVTLTSPPRSSQEVICSFLYISVKAFCFCVAFILRN